MKKIGRAFFIMILKYKLRLNYKDGNFNYKQHEALLREVKLAGL